MVDHPPVAAADSPAATATGSASPGRDRTLIAVTGANGFIGRALIARLLAAGYRVRALLRRDAGLPATCEQVVGPFTASTVQALTAGATAVVHCAGVVRGRADADFAFNRDSVVTLTEALAPTTRVLLISSLAAREPQLSPYARSKRAGEDALAHANLDHWTILRPPAVYGPGDRELAPLFRAMARGLAPRPGNDPAARVSLIHVHDLVAAIEAWIGCLNPPYRAVLPLHDGHAHGYSWPELAAAITQVTNRPVRLVPVPFGLLAAVGHAQNVLARISRFTPMLSRAKVNELFHPDWTCSNDAIQTQLEWLPEVSLPIGIATVLTGARG